MDSVSALSGVDCRFDRNRINPKTMQLVFVAFPLSSQH
jgi:hypothetical protein